MNKKILITFFVALALFLAACGQPAAPTTEEETPGNDNDKAESLDITEEEVNKALDELITAVKNNDTAALEKSYADDFMLVSNDGAAQTKSERLETMKSGDIKYESAEFKDPKIRLYGSTAVVVTSAVGKATVKGESADMNLTVTIVFVKTKDGIREVSAHLTNKAE